MKKTKKKEQQKEQQASYNLFVTFTYTMKQQQQQYKETGMNVLITCSAYMFSILLVYVFDDYFDKLMLNFTTIVSIIIGCCTIRSSSYMYINISTNYISMVIMFKFIINVSLLNGIVFSIIPTISSALCVYFIKDVQLHTYYKYYMFIVPIMIFSSLFEILLYSYGNYIDFMKLPSYWFHVITGICVLHIMITIPILLAMKMSPTMQTLAIHACQVVLVSMILFEIQQQEDEHVFFFTHIYACIMCTLCLSYYFVVYNDMIINIVSDTSQSTFLSNVSHELRTPLNALLGSIQLLKTTQLHHEQKRYLDVCHNASEMMLSIINDILDYSKLEAGALETRASKFNLYHVVTNATSVVGQQASIKNVEVVLDLNRKCPQNIIGDSKLLQQILVNLLGNAVKFTSKGFVNVMIKHVSTLTFKNDACASEFLSLQATGYSPSVVSSKTTSMTATTTTTNNNNGGNTSNSKLRKYISTNQDAQTTTTTWSKLMICVEDSGCGIKSNDDVKSLFHRFYQNDLSSTKTHEGTGLGLAISLKLTELFHGQIGAFSNAYDGATFWFTVWIKHDVNAHIHEEKLSNDMMLHTFIHIIHHDSNVLSLLKNTFDNVQSMRNECIKAPGSYFSRQFIMKFTLSLLNAPPSSDTTVILMHSSVLPMSELVQLPQRIQDYLLKHVVYFGGTNDNQSLTNVTHLNNPLNISELFHVLNVFTKSMKSTPSTPTLHHRHVKRMQKYQSAPVQTTTSSKVIVDACQTRRRNVSVGNNGMATTTTTTNSGNNNKLRKHQTQFYQRKDERKTTAQKQNVNIDVLFQQSSRYLSISSEGSATTQQRQSLDYTNICRTASSHRRLRSSLSSNGTDGSVVVDDDDTDVKNILVAEDNRLNQVIVVNLLRKCGDYNVICVSNGEEAVHEYEKHVKKATPYFDVILMDCYMPLMDGFKATGIIRNLEKQHDIKQQVPIIAFTASTTKIDHDKCLNCGMNSIVTKPVRLQILLNELNTQLNPIQSVVETKKEEDDEQQVIVEVSMPPTNVLIVEDNRMNQIVLVKMLQRHGNFKMIIANDGICGLNEYKKHMDMIDVILMDCYMPNMDGFECALSIRQLNESVPIIAVTASTTRGDHDKCYESGMNDIINKPVKLPILMNILEKHVTSLTTTRHETQKLGA